MKRTIKEMGKGDGAMKSKKKNQIFSVLFVGAMTAVLSIGLTLPGQAQDFPNQAITLYSGFAAGGSVDTTSRAIAKGAEEILGVPVQVENKTGGSGTVCAGLISSKKPDGYSVGMVASDAITRLPDLIKVPYDPLKDFTYIGQYVTGLSSLVVHADSPIKTIDQFVAYAKAHPGLTYGSSGINSHNAIPLEVFSTCKGLKFKEIPFQGGAESVVAMLGKHTDFLCGSGSHIAYVDQGKFRMLFVAWNEKRLPDYPDVPTLLELGCPDVPANTHIILAPKGLPKAVADKLEAAFKKSSESALFQNVRKRIKHPYTYKSRAQCEKDFPVESAYFKEYHRKYGIKTVF